MNKKRKSKAQFEKVNVREKKEKGEEVIRVVTKQSSVEWEVRKFYWHLYRKEETFCSKQDILDRIGELKGVVITRYFLHPTELLMRFISCNGHDLINM